jgi:hypothetical protein
MEAAHALLTRATRPDAILCGNSLLTEGALLTIRAQGLRIPDDVALAGFDDTVWQWDGARWSPAPVYRPPAVLGRYGHFAGQAPGGSALVAFGVAPGGLRQDSYLLDLGSGQFAPQLGLAPAPRAEAAVAYDEERGEVLLFGGRGDTVPLGDTWSFTPAAGWRALK